MINNLLKLGLLLAIAIAFFPIEHHLIILAIISAALMALTAFGLYKKEIEFRDIISPYSLFIFVLFIWSGMSRFWSRDTDAWLIGVGIIFIALAMVISLKIASRDNLFRRQLAWWITFVIMIHQLTGWYYVFQRDLHLHLDQVFQFNLTLGNPNLFFRNINDYALMMFFAVFWSLILPVNFISNDFLRKMAKGMKYFFILSSIGQVFFAGSRGIFVASVLALGFYAFLHIRKKSLRLDILLVSALMVVVFLLFFWPQIVEYLANDSSAVIRFNLVRNGWQHLKLTNFVGVGVGQVSYFQGHYPFHWTGNLTLMHNWFMGLITANGLVIGVFYVCYYVWVFIRSYLLSTNYRKPLARFVSSFLLGFVIAGMIPDSLFTYIWFWLMHHLVFITHEFESDPIGLF